MLELKVVHDPPLELAAVTEIHVFLSMDDEGREGLCALTNPATGQWFPAIAANPRVIDKMEAALRELIGPTGKTLRRVIFRRVPDA